MKYKILPYLPDEKSGYLTTVQKAMVNYLIENNTLNIGDACQSKRHYCEIIDKQDNIITIMFTSDFNSNLHRSKFKQKIEML